MKRILVPTDFTSPAKAAFNFAVDLAARWHAAVDVVHMNEVSLLPETTFGVQPPRFDRDMLADVIETATRSFESMVKAHPSDVPISFRTIDNDVVPGVLAYIDNNDIDLVVMSRHGANALGDFFIGSATEEIARYSPVPVLSISREIHPGTIRSIVFPTTLELNQNELMTSLKALQSLLAAKLHVVLINTPANFYNDQEAKRRLERFARFYDLRDFTLNFRCHQFERSGILEFANEVHADLIAMATRGRTGLAHFFKGSITEAILNRIEQPIWTWNLKSQRQR